VTADIRGVHAEAPEVELDLARHVLELRGGVRLTRGQGCSMPSGATIEIATAKVTLKDVKGSLPVACPSRDSFLRQSRARPRRDAAPRNAFETRS